MKREGLRHRGRLILAVLTCVFLTGCPGPAAKTGQKPAKKPPPVNMTVEIGHANSVVKEALSPVKVTLGQNENAINGKIELDDLRGGRTEMPVELPRQANKVYTLFVPLSQAIDRNTGESAEIRVKEGGRVLARQSLIPVYVSEARVLLSATDDGSGLQFLHDQNRYRVAHLQPRELPRAWAGYNPASVVALNGRAWTAMDDDQRRALRMWVENGGRAILCGELTTQWRDPEGLTLAGVRPVRFSTPPTLECLQTWGEHPLSAGGGTLLTVSGPLQPGARTLFEQDGVPVVVRRRCGNGTVLWLGFDAFRERLREWEGGARFWRRALDEAQRSTEPDSVHSPDEVEAVRAAAGALPRLPVPPMPAIIAFGAVYAFIFGPLNIWMLRRLRRTVKAWLFVPALALGMTGVVLFAGQSWGNARTVLNSVSLLSATGGGRTARERTLAGLFSPTNRDFDLSVEDVAPDLQDRGSTDPQVTDQINLGWPDFQSDGVSRWDAVPLVLFSTRLLQLDRPRDLGGSIDATLTGSTGSVRNGTNLKLRSAYLVSRRRFHWLGDLPAGQSAAVAARGWEAKLTPALEGELPGPAARGQFIENQRFWDSIRRTWRTAGETLVASPAAREDTWLIAECEGHRSPLGVSGVPYSNQAGLLLVRLTPPGGPR